MNRSGLLGFVVFALCTGASLASIGGYISPLDKKKLFGVLTKAFKNTDGDFTTSYYGAKGFKLFNEPLPAVLVKESCEQIKSNYKATASAEDTFLALSAWSLLQCGGKIQTDATLTNTRAVLDNGKATITEVRHALETLKFLGVAIPTPGKIAKFIQTKLKEDDSLQNLGQALHAAALLGNDGAFINDRVEEIIAQSDEVDGKLLQWEGGLTTTSLLITGLLRLPGKTFTGDQAEKLAAYLLTRKTVQTPKGALALIEAASSLALSDVSPVSISIIGVAQVTIDKPDLKLHISDIMGRALKTTPTPVIAQSATRITDDVVVLSKQPVSPGTSPVEYNLPLRLEPGQYRIVISAGVHSTTFTVRVLGPVKLEWIEIGLSDDDGSAPRLQKLQHPSKLATALNADSTQHLVAKLSLTKPIHQVFLRLYSNNQEIIFVAEQDTTKIYKLDVNLASELSHSGTFKIELILGDSVMSNPLRWIIGSIDVSLNAPPSDEKATRGPKQEIKHLFRPAEKRPPESVSLLFTALTLAPLLLLLILWLNIGIDISNFTTLSIPFHVGFGGILYLFTLFWLKLDMFTTCAWLIPIGGFTFLSGQKLLSHIAKQKKT